jgi:hypothetical protein
VTRPRSILVPTVVAAAFLLVGVGPVLAQEEGGDEAPAVQTETTFAEGEAPAVVLSDDAAQEDEPAWTFRYLVPTVLAISGLTLAAVILSYGLRVRGRYRVVR